MGDNTDDHFRRNNLLWEGSRMFLPEHREQLLEKRRSLREFRMPELDEDWLAEMNRALADSLEHNCPITIVYGTTYETRPFTGIVRQINPYDGWVKLVRTGDDDTAGDVLQIAFRRIVEIRDRDA